MRIAHLLISGDVAGGQLVALALARAAREAGHEALFLSPSSGEFVLRAEAEGFDVRVVGLGGALDLPSLLQLRALLRHERVDLLHTHAHFSLNVLGRLAGRTAGIPVVAHMHIENVFRSGGPARTAQIVLDNATARLCAAIVAVSESTRQALLNQGYPDRVVVVHNGVGTGRDVVPVRPPGVPDAAPMILQVARLAEVKGQRELIEALATLEQRDAIAVFVGKDIETGGAYARQLERLARDLGLAARAVFAGYRDDVPALLAAADVFVLPSHLEGLPLVVLEAMAAGKPVVATPAGGTAELVDDGVTGILVPPGDVPALAAALDAVLGDPQRAHALGEAGRRRVNEHFSMDTQARRVLQVYDDVLRRLDA